MRTLLAATTLLLTSLAAAGCEPDYLINGYDMPDHFPLDGSVRVWEYASTDSAVLGGLNVEKAGSVVQDDVEVVTLEHWTVSENESEDLAWEVQWSSDDVDGVRIHGYRNALTDEEVTFDPPVQFTERNEVPGDQVVTSSGGFNWTATFEGVDGCATYWVQDWENAECLIINLDDGDGSPETNGVIVGSYWLVPRYGTAWMEVDAYDTLWSLANHQWEP